MFRNPEFYKYLKEATKEASELLHSIKSAQIGQKEGNIDDFIASEPSFKLCVQYLTENPITESLKSIQKPEELKDEAREMLLLIIKKYLGCPYISIIAVI
jgi:hypothetical protein